MEAGWKIKLKVREYLLTHLKTPTKESGATQKPKVKENFNIQTVEGTLVIG